MAGKRWDGTKQVDIQTYKRWDGTSWLNMVGKRWTGTVWETFTFKLNDPILTLTKQSTGLASSQEWVIIIDLNGNPSYTSTKITKTEAGTTTILQDWTLFNGYWSTDGFDTNVVVKTGQDITFIVYFSEAGQQTSALVNTSGFAG